MSSKPRGRLGRGLEALIPVGPEGGGEADRGLPQWVGVEEVRPSPQQQRQRFGEEQLRELADSIREHGVLQPLLLRRQPDGYELIAGERRLRAARLAGLDRVPAIVRGEVDPQDSLLLGLIENLQREDLDPIEEAQGIQSLIESFGFTHEGAAARLGRNRAAVTNSLRLLNGCPALTSATRAGAISAGHARALVGLPTPADQEYGLKVVLARGLTVRQTEKWVKEYTPPEPKQRRNRRTDQLAGVRSRLRSGLGEAADIVGSPERGRVTLRYETPEQLEQLLGRLLG